MGAVVFVDAAAAFPLPPLPAITFVVVGSHICHAYIHVQEHVMQMMCIHAELCTLAPIQPRFNASLQLLHSNSTGQCYKMQLHERACVICIYVDNIYVQQQDPRGSSCLRTCGHTTKYLSK
jgi:hypothetical protein